MINQSSVRLKRVARLFEEEKWLSLTGVLGFVLAGLCAVWIMLYGGPVGAEGDMSKAFSFNAALGIFLLSTAVILPYSGMGRRGKAFFRWAYIGLALYSYFAETVQNIRGVDPRFAQTGVPFDGVVSSLFALAAVLLIVFYVYLGAYYFRKKTYEQHPELVVSIRYAMIAVLISFAAGLWISVFNQGRYIGAEGNIIWLHGLGFHALQALPFVAWLSLRQPLEGSSRLKLIHTSGIAFLLGLLAIGWQTYLGSSIMEWSVLPVAATICFIISLVPVANLLFRQSKKELAA